MNIKMVPVTLILLVGIILTGSVLAPVVKDFADDEVTYVNNVGQQYRMTEDVTPVTFTYSDGVFKIGDYTPTRLNANYCMVLSENFAIRQVSGNMYYAAFSEGTYTNTSLTSMTLTIAKNGTYSGTVNSTEVSGTYTHIYYQDANGSYTFMDGSNPIYCTDSTELYCIGYNSSVTNRYFFVSGSIEGGFKLTTLDGTEYTASAVNSQAIEGYTDLYLLSSVSFDVGGTSVSVSTLMGDYIVLGHKDVDATTANMHNLLMVVPLLVLVAILMVAVGAIVSRRQ